MTSSNLTVACLRQENVIQIHFLNASHNNGSTSKNPSLNNIFFEAPFFYCKGRLGHLDYFSRQGLHHWILLWKGDTLWNITASWSFSSFFFLNTNLYWNSWPSIYKRSNLLEQMEKQLHQCYTSWSSSCNLATWRKVSKVSSSFPLGHVVDSKRQLKLKGAKGAKSTRRALLNTVSAELSKRLYSDQ